jgi:hypothetical protein
MDIVLSDSDRFQRVESIGNSAIYRNLRALPRAWLVPRVVTADPTQVLQAIRTSVGPDGNPFDPREVALVEEAFSLDSQRPLEGASAVVVEASGSRVEVVTQSPQPAFLVLSDPYYPGWKASIDGQETKIFQTDYALRGVAVPAGGHSIVLRYRPLSFYLGVGIGSVTFLALLGLVLSGLRKRRDRRVD